MKYKLLRGVMKKKNLCRPYTYCNKTLIIDGSCFKEMYIKSNSPFILGGEYDRFASYLRNHLSIYIKSNIKCYVVFNGAMNADIKRREEIHQNIIDRVDAIEPGKDNVYCEPIFVKDVYKDVLDELGIKYYICMYDSKETMFSLARKFNCPIVSNNFEYALYNVTIIPFKSVVFNKESSSITCSICHASVCKRWNSFSDDIMSIVLTISDEDSRFYGELLKIFKCRTDSYIVTMLYWIRRQSKESVIKFFKSHLQEENLRVLLDTMTELRGLFNSPQNSFAADYLMKDTKPNGKLWFEYAVATGRVPIQFINLKNLSILSGSWVVFDKNREDAILPTIDIALYAQGLLTDSQDVKITFIGRKLATCNVSQIQKVINIEKGEEKSHSNKTDIFESIDHFQNFVLKQLPGFDFSTLETVPEDCWILIITLLYYSVKTDRPFINEVYCIILSYVLLGHISEKVGVIKRSNFTVTHGLSRDDHDDEDSEDIMNNDKNSFTSEQCRQAANAVINLFYISEDKLKGIYNRDTLHTLGEFQYCLQFMNYLNRLCGERIQCTVYHKTINCTFIYNLLLTLNEVGSPEVFIRNLLDCPPVFLYFKNIIDFYFDCLALFVPSKVVKE